MSRKQALLRGTFILTTAGFLSRIMGFFYRIFLSRTFGAEGVGLYQLIFPVFTLCFSLTTAGIETAISRTVANRCSPGSIHGHISSHGRENEKESVNILLSGIFCSLILSFFCVFMIHQNAAFIAKNLLGDLRCEPLLKILVLTFPFSSIHSCIAGFYYGWKCSKIPAFCQLIEQTARIGGVFLLYYIYKQNGVLAPLTIAVYGLVIGEAFSAFYSLFNLRKYFKFHQFHFANAVTNNCIKELFMLSFPLTVNRVLVNLLQSIEAISIPIQLQKFSMNSSEALSVYGILNGMALPCVLFPSAITTSAASMLMPTVAEIQSTGSHREILNLTKKACSLCFLLGLICCFAFLISGQWIGSVLFHEPSAGDFIITLAWICPFLYTNTAFQSVINGLGKTTLTLFTNVLGLAVRILSVYMVIPHFGIKGYLWGLLASQLIISTASAVIIYLSYGKSR